ncbi:MAG: ATP-binding cassette domain-containing protein, partial [Spirochaetales bacterium]|nr:ATP-binding cassette domain-containing protein [Spirochaetales bacterium]
GEILGLLGLNGAGKSSIFKILLGIIQPDSGTVRLHDELLKNPIGSRKVAYLSQFSFLPNRRSIGWCTRMLIPAESGRRDFSPFVEQNRAKKAVELSRGSCRLIELNLIAAMERPILLLDEPFAQIDPIHSTEIKAEIKKGAEHRATIISDHDYRNVIDVSTRIALLKDGEIQEVGTAQELIQAGYLPKT